MGFRFRKSINIGGFRINFSKSGVGYSFGGKGFRYTKTVRGGHRATMSIPGTGLSYVSETHNKRNKNAIVHPNNNNQQLQDQPLYTFENSNDFTSASKQDFLNAIKHYKKTKKTLKLTLFLEVIILFGLISGVDITASNKTQIGVQMLFGILMILDLLLIAANIIAVPIYSLFGRVKVQYCFDLFGERFIEMLNNSICCLKGSEMISKVNQEFFSEARKNGGATRSISMVPIKFTGNNPRFLKTDVKCHCVHFKKESYYILPDMIIVERKNGYSAVDLNDLDIKVNLMNYVTRTPAKDANIIDYTWRFVNKDGSQDRRYANNYREAVTQCAVIDFSTKDGFNFRIQMSNVVSAQKFADIVTEMINLKVSEG